ncbi:hypothetical protein DOTSEDRAFT_72960 [Dothistroma septosporum NZE10]|uniref:Uncharacterized protein n=1 Tax=Dothistroma septosporum (strain NZE10 / CBS 128990) TaxID=675120 RepID=N1PKE9_DOTSN|nr:hypothetical protein DOTSEDRAFT_72960 [Dothistroma septosporum NZE10]
MGYVDVSDDFTTPGYGWLTHVPLPRGYRGAGGAGEGRVWFGLGAMLFVTSSCHLTYVRRFHETKFIQHLGRISFMLYLIHIMINLLISLPLRQVLYHALCGRKFDETFDSDVLDSGPLTNILIYTILWLVSVPIAMSCAHFLEVWVDKPCNKFGKWVDDKFVNGFRRIKLRPGPGEEEEGLLRTIPLDRIPSADAAISLETAEPLLSPKISLESASSSSIDRSGEVAGKG